MGDFKLANVGVLKPLRPTKGQRHAPRAKAKTLRRKKHIQWTDPREQELTDQLVHETVQLSPHDAGRTIDLALRQADWLSQPRRSELRDHLFATRRRLLNLLTKKIAPEIEALAKVVDPAAWSAHPQPTITEYERQIKALMDEIEWQTATPTTPEGEYHRILAERRQHVREAPYLRPIQADANSTRERRQIAVLTAMRLIEAYRNAVPRKALIQVVQKGRKPIWLRRSI